MIACDLTIFGSGFAAYELARVATERGRSVTVIERGAADPSSADPELSRVPFRREPIVSGGLEFGARVSAAFESVPRYVGLGGTSELWSGKWRRLDRVDIERGRHGRQWLVAYDELSRYYDHVAADYGWPDWTTDTEPDTHRATLAREGLQMVEMYEELPPLRLGPRWSDLARERGVTMLCDTTFAGVDVDAGGARVTGVRVRRAGDEQVVSSDQFVVACGGIESVHMSHVIRAACASPAAPALPTAYGGFMDHPKAFVGEVSPGKGERLLDYWQGARNERRRLFALALPEDDLRATGLGNHTVFLWPTGTPAGAHPFRIVINLEQFPESHNVVAHAPTRAVSWRLSRATWADYEAFMARLTPRLTAAFGEVRRVADPGFRGASHPAGALPMGEPGQGHVDAQLRFHELANVYCVSSAVFPSAGSANPTMTVVALARRLADHLYPVSRS